MIKIEYTCDNVAQHDRLKIVINKFFEHENKKQKEGN